MEKDLKPKISIRDGCFAHAVALGSGDFNWPPDYFNYDRSKKWRKVCLFTDQAILEDVVDKSKSKINIGWVIEPYSVSQSVYNKLIDKNTYSKYDLILTHNKELCEYNPDVFKFYPFGGCWIQKRNRKLHKKTKYMSIIASSKKMTYGHKLRHEIIHGLSGFDIYGNGYSYIKRKEEALIDYGFSIVIENDNNEYFFSEKLIDCLITGTIPIYWGADISSFFDMRGFILFKDMEELRYKSTLITNETYNSVFPIIKDNFKRAKLYTCPENWIYKNVLQNIL